MQLFIYAKLIAYQIKYNNIDHTLLDTHLVLFLHFGTNVGWWSFLGFIHNTPKVHENQPISNMNFPIFRYSSLNFSMTLPPSPLGDAIVRLKIVDIISNHLDQYIF